LNFQKRREEKKTFQTKPNQPTMDNGPNSPDTQRKVIKSLKNGVCGEERWRMGEEAVLVGFDIPASDLVEESSLQPGRVEWCQVNDWTQKNEHIESVH
jgi:hypothetical protein